MTTTVRRSLPVLIALLLLGATTPGTAATSSTFPTQSLGNRGADVRAIQGLLRAHALPLPIDGIFNATTEDQVKAFQAERGLPVDGLVDAATWSKLIVSLGPGSTGEAVKALQRQLNEKRGAGLVVDGLYGTATRKAVITFQEHMGMTLRGYADPVTWRAVLWHYDYPVFRVTSLCDYSVGNGRANWGTGAAIGQLEAAAAAFAATGHGRVSVGDLSWEHGGSIPGHDTHRVGLDADLRLIRKARDQCSWGTNWRFSSYDRAATRALIRAIRAAAPGHVKLVYFNDPVLIREGLTTWYPGHEDHLHVRYCEARYPVARYRC